MAFWRKQTSFLLRAAVTLHLAFSSGSVGLASRSSNQLSCSSWAGICKSECKQGRSDCLVATDSTTSILRMRRSVRLCTVLHYVSECMFCVFVRVHAVKHSCGAKGFSCHQGYFPACCMPLVDQGGLLLGSDNFGTWRDWGKKKKRRKVRTTMAWNAFFKESKTWETT